MRIKMKQMLNKKVHGIGVIELILILVVVIGLVVIFRHELEGIIDNVMDEITRNTDTFVIEDYK